MAQQTIQEPKCNETGRPFFMFEEVVGTHLLVRCSECNEILLEEEIG